MPFLATPRLTFHYRSHGDPEGLPLLLLHGSYGSSRWWEPFFTVTPTELWAIAPDLRGCGLSDKPDHGYGIEDQTQDLLAFVDALAWRGFDLVAHSSSAAIAVEFALHHQERLNTLVLVDPVPVEGVHTPLEMFLLLEQMKTDRELLSQGLAAMVPSFDAADRPTNQANHRFFQQMVDDATQMAPAAFTEVAAALGRWNRFAEVKALTLPTLLIWGDRDEIVNRDAIARSLIAIPGANNLEVLRGVGHSPMIEAPLTLAEKIVDFITEDYSEYDRIRGQAADIPHE